MNNGWIKLHRKLLDHPLREDPETMWVWIVMLLLATHDEIKMDWCGETIKLKPGQFITSRKSLSEKTGVEESKVYRILKRLKSEQQIEQRPSNLSTLITITNWDKHQNGEQLKEQQVNSNRTATEQRVNTNNKDKKEKNVENEKKKEYSSDLFFKTVVQHPLLIERGMVPKADTLKKRIEEWKSDSPGIKFSPYFNRYIDWLEAQSPKTKNGNNRVFTTGFDNFLKPNDKDQDNSMKEFIPYEER